MKLTWIVVVFVVLAHVSGLELPPMIEAALWIR